MWQQANKECVGCGIPCDQYNDECRHCMNRAKRRFGDEDRATLPVIIWHAPHPLVTESDFQREAFRLRQLQQSLCQRAEWQQRQAEARAQGWHNPDDIFAAAERAQINGRRDPYAREREYVRERRTALAAEQHRMEARGAQWDGNGRRWHLPDGSHEASELRPDVKPWKRSR
jgi:hypothetical protein